MNNLLAQVNIGNSFLGGSASKLGNINRVNVYVSALIAGAISLAGIILLVILIMGGISMIQGAGKSDPQKMEQGKKAATSALIGFVVVFAAYWIVQLIVTITGLPLL